MDTSSSSPDPFHGLSPQSLMAAAAMPTDGDADTLPLAQRDLPSLQEIAAAFPDLEILDLIGHGGMSAVFRARQPKLDRLVALKVLPKSLAATPGFPERFNREGRVLARLSHPHIVAVHDFGESGGFCYLIMEHVDGVNLRQAMRAGRFTPEQALNIVPALCDALQFAHSQGVLHRDIKPENILLDSKGRVKIADFGIAKILGEDGGDSMLLTQSGAKLGTAPYMAPEQIEKPATVDHRADIYSLGVVFYEMLTGELPLGRFAAPSEKAAVSGGMDEVVFRALAKERERRQQSAGEFKTQVANIASMPAAAQQVLAQRFQSFEYKSKRTLLGMPLLHVTSGIDPATGQKRVARGFFAFGDVAVGVLAFGGYARGLFACGGLAVGLIAFGGVSVGLVCWGGVALALLLAVGGLAIGPLATGGLAIGWQAMGGLAVAWHANGARVFAQHGMGMEVHAAHVYQAFAEMPAALRWMTSASRWTSLLSFLWLPLMLPLPIMSWWARRQLEIEAEGAPAPAQEPNRVFWAFPALLVPAAVLWWMVHRWVLTSPGLEAHLVFATMTEFIGLLLFGASVPLWMRIVPMNSFYGVRMPSTLASTTRWYDVNAYFGKQGVGWSLALMAAGIAGFYQLPRHQDSYSWAALALSLVAIGAAVVATLWWMRQHPVDGTKPKRSLLASAGGQVFLAVVVAMFIKCFIASPYKIAGGAEVGVTMGSHWMVSRLDTGFQPGELVIYQHESGNHWIGRVMKREAKGLLLKRGGSAEEFLVPWDKIAGKMLFAHFSPDVPQKTSAPVPAPPPPAGDGTAKALNKAPVLRFTRLTLNNHHFEDQVYTPKGGAVSLAESGALIARSSGIEVSNQNKESCWLQLWFEHPDFDRNCELEVSLLGTDGQELKGRDHEIGRTVWASDKPEPAMQAVVLSPGRRGSLPATVRVVLRYSIGPWEKGTTLKPDFHGSLSLGNHSFLAGFGDDADQRAFVSWSKPAADEILMDAVVVLKDGTRQGSQARLKTGGGETLVERVNFTTPLREVGFFQFRDRKIREVTFDNVVVPPLPQ